MHKKGRILLIISMIIGLIYMIYSAIYWGGANSGAASDAAAIGTGIATMLVAPHLIVTGIALLLNIIAVFTVSRGLTLAAAILYCVAMLFMPMYFMFVLIEAILCFVAFARIPKKS